jgi:hypothetical protein
MKEGKIIRHGPPTAKKAAEATKSPDVTAGGD